MGRVKVPSWYIDQEEMIRRIHEVAKIVGKPPIEVTRRELMSYGKVPKDNIALFGPYSAFKRAHLEPIEIDLGARTHAKANNSRIYQLEKQVGNAEYLLKVFRDTMEDLLKKHGHHLPVPADIPKKKGPAKSEIVAVLSDTHFGYTVEPDEIVGNEWNPTIAARRCGLFAKVVSEFKAHKGDSRSLRVCLNGDIIQGLIHMDDYHLREYVYQMWEARWYLSAMIRYWASVFPQIIIECQTGNHDRVTHRAPGRARAQKYNSHATVLYLWLRDLFANFPNVEFNIVKTPISKWEVFGHTYALAHGDTDIPISNPSNKLDTGQINHLAKDVQLSPQFEGKLDAMILGHHHASTYTWLPSGVDLVVNGNIDGVSPFASSLGFRTNRASQVVFESLPEHPVGDFRAVRLWLADDAPEYEKIVPQSPSFTDQV